MKSMTISELGRKVGIGRETIRFYERKGILPMPQKDTRGYRVYSGEDVKRLQFVRSSKLLGFSLDEIVEILTIHENSENSCDTIKVTVVEKIEEINEKILQLKKINKALNVLKNNCNPAQSSCAVIDQLEKENFYTK